MTCCFCQLQFVVTYIIAASDCSSLTAYYYSHVVLANYNDASFARALQEIAHHFLSTFIVLDDAKLHHEGR